MVSAREQLMSWSERLKISINNMRTRPPPMTLRGMWTMKGLSNIRFEKMKEKCSNPYSCSKKWRICGERNKEEILLLK